MAAPSVGLGIRTGSVLEGHIRVSVREGGSARLIRIKRRKPGSGVTVMRQEDGRHLSARRMTAAVFRPHRSQASTRDSLMTNHLPERSPNGPPAPPPGPESNPKRASSAACRCCCSGNAI